jgi:hypothetical protein
MFRIAIAKACGRADEEHGLIVSEPFKKGLSVSSEVRTRKHGTPRQRRTR